MFARGATALVIVAKPGGGFNDSEEDKPRSCNGFGPKTMAPPESGSRRELKTTPEAQANLFTPFFSTKPHGQGIGLTLVQEVLSAHGCDYVLERVENEVTRFTIVF